ncbi:MAG: sugar phosphate isomerase/epimerase family protein [Phycisphaerales bacterium]
MKFAFSTIACPEWTLEEVCETASRHGYMGVEMRTFGHASTDLACDPLLTGAAKVRDLFEDAGVTPTCLATSIRFDKPVWPPVIGHAITDTEKPIREARAMVEAAAQREIGAVRVYGFELSAREPRRSGMRRIVERLSLACATARNTGVKIVLENAGSIPRAEDLQRIIDDVGSPLLLAAYAPAVAQAAGEDPNEGVRLLADRLASVKLTDRRGGRPVPLGEGDTNVQGLLSRLDRIGFEGWVVYEWPRLWLPELGDAHEALPDAAEKLYRWGAPPRADGRPSTLARAR